MNGLLENNFDHQFKLPLANSEDFQHGNAQYSTIWCLHHIQNFRTRYPLTIINCSAEYQGHFFCTNALVELNVVTYIRQIGDFSKNVDTIASGKY